jgi:hypothetical protein
MILEIEGTVTGSARPPYPKFDGARISAHVYSKTQARKEFERFLNATELPESTDREMKLDDEEKGRI